MQQIANKIARLAQIPGMIISTYISTKFRRTWSWTPSSLDPSCVWIYICRGKYLYSRR